jgi:hypothetical protein
VLIVLAQQNVDGDDSRRVQGLGALDCFVQHSLREHDLVHR